MQRAPLKVPAVLRSRERWIRRSASKVPLTVDGSIASSTDPDTWSSFEAAMSSAHGVGLGFVLDGDGIGCYDLDHCIVDGRLTAEAAAFIDSTDHFYAELSPSGEGVHLWVAADSQSGWRRTVDGLQVEFYTRGQYITITGRMLQTG